MGEKISINQERDYALRLTEVQIINRDHEGNEAQGVIVNCHDNGEITVREVVTWEDGLPGGAVVDQTDG